MHTANNNIEQTSTIWHLEDHQHHSTCLSLCYLHFWCCDFSPGDLKGNIWIAQFQGTSVSLQINFLIYFPLETIRSKKHNCIKARKLMLFIVDTMFAWYPVWNYPTPCFIYFAWPNLIQNKSHLNKLYWKIYTCN